MLTGKQNALIFSMVVEESWFEACRVCGVPQMTFVGWLLTAEFRAAYQRFHAASFREALAALVEDAQWGLTVVLASTKGIVVTELLDDAAAILEWVGVGIENLVAEQRREALRAEFLATL